MRVSRSGRSQEDRNDRHFVLAASRLHFFANSIYKQRCWNIAPWEFLHVSLCGKFFLQIQSEEKIWQHLITRILDIICTKKKTTASILIPFRIWSYGKLHRTTNYVEPPSKIINSSSVICSKEEMAHVVQAVRGAHVTRTSNRCHHRSALKPKKHTYAAC